MSIRKSISNLLFLLITTTLLCCHKDEDNNPMPAHFRQTDPASNSTVASWNPTLTWQASPKASSYSLLVATNSDYTSPIVDVTNLTEPKYALLTSLTGSTQYFWKVTAYNELGSTEATNAGISFTTPEEPSPGNTYHVSTTGTDSPGNGSIVNPFKSLAYAATQVPAELNKFIYLHAGTYIETEPTILPLGVNIIGDGVENTILSSKGVTLPAGVNANSPEYKEQFQGSLIQLFSSLNSDQIPANGNQTLSGFAIDGNNKTLKAGVWMQNRSAVAMHHVTIKDCAYRGAVFTGGFKNYPDKPEAWLKDIKIYDCKISNSGKNIYKVADPTDLDETLGNLCIGGLDGADIYNLTINDNKEGYGIKFIFNGYFKNTKIHDCSITMLEIAPKWGENPSIELWDLGPGNEIYNINCNTWISLVNKYAFKDPVGTENLKLYNVRIIDLDGFSSKETIECGAPGIEIYDCYFENKGFGMAIWDYGNKNITIRNNTFSNTHFQTNFAGAGPIYIDNSTLTNFKGIKIYNNVFDKYRDAVVVKGQKVLDVMIKNNVFLNVSGYDVINTTTGSIVLNFDNNLKYIENTTKVINWKINGELSSDRNNIIADPDFLNTGEKWEDTFYKPLSQASAVVDKGADVGLPFSGVAPDIGRFEFNK